MLMHATHMYFKYKHILKLLKHKPAVSFNKLVLHHKTVL